MRSQAWTTHANAAKAAIESLTNTLAVEWGCFGIRIVALAPGPVANTEAMNRLTPFADDVEKQNRAFDNLLPLANGLGQIEDMANAALFLVSPAARIITGTTLVVDGGSRWPMPSIPRELVREIQKQHQASRQPKAKL